MSDGPTKKQLRMVDVAIKKASALVLSENEGRVDSEGLKRMTRDYFGGSEVKASIVRIIFDGLRKAGGEPSLYRKFTTVMQVLKVVLLKIFKGFMQLVYGATRALAGDARPGGRDIVRLADFDDLKSGILAYLKRFGILGGFAHVAAGIVLFILAPILVGLKDIQLDSQTAFGLSLSVAFSILMVVAGNGLMLPLFVICICGIVVATWYVVNQASKLIELTYEKVDDIYTRAYDRLMSDVKDVPANMASERKTADTSEKTTVAESIADTIRRLNAVMA